MMNKCINCLLPLSEGNICRHCGYDNGKPLPCEGELPPHTVLNGRYEVGRVLGRGGFGITYAGRDLKRNKICAVKEYMPHNYAHRSMGKTVEPRDKEEARHVFNKGKEGFLKEAENLKRLSDIPTVVDCYDYFRENNTAYLVMERLEGIELSKLARQKGGRIPHNELYPIFVSVARTLVEIHKRGMAHRDLSPDNIFYLNDGRVVLIDFGAARDYVNSFASGLSVYLKRNYSPPEQYLRMGKQGPWSDVYSLCATYYRLVSGTFPDVTPGQKAKTLIELGAPVPQRMSDVIAKGLEPKPEDRYQNFVLLLEALGECGGKFTPETTQPVRDFYLYKCVRGKPLQCIPIESGELTIGRDPSHRMTVDNDFVSRDHCKIERQGDDLYITDISKNGTFWENRRKLEKNKRYKIQANCRFYLYTPEPYSFLITDKKLL